MIILQLFCVASRLNKNDGIFDVIPEKWTLFNETLDSLFW